MRVAINMTRPEGGPLPENYTRYLRRILDIVREVQQEVRLLLLADPDDRADWHGFECISPATRSSALNALRRGSTDPVADTAREAKAELLVSPWATAPATADMPQVILALELAPFEPDPDQPHHKPTPAPRSLRKLCNSARCMLVPSEYLRKRCLELLDVPLNQVVVAPPGVDPVFEQPEGSFVQQPYLVVHMDPLMAPLLPRWLEAQKQLEKETPHTIVIIGPGFPGEPKNWGDRVVRIEQLPDRQLAGLHQNAALFVFPTLHDGAVLRVLEALRAGVPVVAAKSGAIHELAKDLPIYYNPGNTAVMVQAIRRGLTLKKEERDLKQRLARGHVSKLAWDKTAWRFLAALKHT